jgi:glycosyltransferase involved in cell wall biosynthesis
MSHWSDNLIQYRHEEYSCFLFDIFYILYIVNLKQIIIMKPSTDRSPKISLIIPAYNEEKYLRACLEHAIKNTQGVVHEIIVIDNASTDSTNQVAKQFPSVKVIYEPRKGLTRARERGYQESTGDIVAYIDADTHMPEKWGSILLEEFTKDHDLVCLSGPYFFYDLSRFPQLIFRLSCHAGYLIAGFFVMGGNFAIKRDVLKKMKGFDTSIEFYGEDSNVARRASEFGKVKFVDRFYIETSGRRFIGQGMVKTSWIYLVNFFSESFLKRPATKEHKDIR